MNLKNKHVLITAGPTWAPIDSVRVISNTATGQTGRLLAERLCRLGAKVTLVLGPVGSCCLKGSIKVINFRFFDELKKILSEEIKNNKYDILIHSAAVSDYLPERANKHKISSGLKELIVRLKPAPKIIDLVKKLDHEVFLVGFKFEPGADRRALLTRARKLVLHSKADLVVANTITEGQYRAYIISKNKNYYTVSNKIDLSNKLIKLMTSDL